MNKKTMKFEFEIEVPEDLESFVGIELSLQNGERPYQWEVVYGNAFRSGKIREGKHLLFTDEGYTVKKVGERTPEEQERIESER